MEISADKVTLDQIERIARAAGGVVMTGYRTSGIQVSEKQPTDLVTEYDLRSEELILRLLDSVFPGVRVVAEESAVATNILEDDWVFYVDPIDGTTNFAHGHPFFGVSISLCKGNECFLAVTHAPALNITWQAGKGLGTRRNGDFCNVSKSESISDALASTGFPNTRRTNPDDNTAELHAILKHVRGIRRCGAACLDLALVADGTYDLFWEHQLKPWDMAAGSLFVQEAGGIVSNAIGEDFRIDGMNVLAANSFVHEEAARILREARRGKGLLDATKL